jgi:hypothetical protein
MHDQQTQLPTTTTGRLAWNKGKLTGATDLLALMDRDSACVARVEQSPDGFSLMTVDSQGAKTVLGWAKTKRKWRAAS